MRTPRPGPTSSTTSSVVESGEAADDAEDVLVDEEVLAERLLRRRRVMAAERRPRRWRASRRRARAASSPRTLGERRDRVDDVRRLVRRPRTGCGDEVRAVGLDEDPVRGHRRGGLAKLARLRIRRVSRERDVVPALERSREQSRATRSSGGSPCPRSLRARRPCPRRPRGCGRRPGGRARPRARAARRTAAAARSGVA